MLFAFCMRCMILVGYMVILYQLFQSFSVSCYKNEYTYHVWVNFVLHDSERLLTVMWTLLALLCLERLKDNALENCHNVW